MMTTHPQAAADRMFVYGSLRRGVPGSRHALIGGLARYLGLGRTRGRLYRVGDYPALVTVDSDTAWVRGEIYDFSAAPHLFDRLDAYEGCAPSDPTPHQFRREAHEVILDTGERLVAWLYVYTRLVSDDHWIPSGDYRPPR